MTSPLPPAFGHHPDECVPNTIHNDTCKALRNLYDAALEARAYVDRHAAPEGVTSDDHRAGLAARHLERLDAALADAQEELL